MCHFIWENGYMYLLKYATVNFAWDEQLYQIVFDLLDFQRDW